MFIKVFQIDIAILKDAHSNEQYQKSKEVTTRRCRQSITHKFSYINSRDFDALSDIKYQINLSPHLYVEPPYRRIRA